MKTFQLEPMGRKAVFGAILALCLTTFLAAASTGVAFADEEGHAANDFGCAPLVEPAEGDSDGFNARAVANTSTYMFNFKYNQADSRTMLKMVNDFRASNAWYWNSDNTTKSYAGKLPALSIDPRLEQAAMQRAAECAILYSHTRPNGDDCFSVYESTSGLYGFGENIAAGYTSVASMFEGWKEENQKYSGQGHRRNMLGADFNAIGIAYVDVDGVRYWAMELAEVDSVTDPGAAFGGNRDVSVDVLNGKVAGGTAPTISPSSMNLLINETAALPSAYWAYTIRTTADSYGVWNWANRSFKRPLSPSWSSGDSSIARISGSTVTGMKEGATSISFVDVGKTYSVPVKVSTTRPQSMYRLYNPNSGEHFYTASAGERDVLIGVGWRYEGVGWTAPSSSKSPVYRLYNANAGDHHYTMSAGERDSLIRVGWSYEGIGWYSDDAKGVPLYRQYNPNAKAGSHNYTTSLGEHNQLVRIGWQGEGIGWYGCK